MPNKPILQLNAFPIVLEPKLYSNARSTSNPNGTLTSLYAFRNLVDPIPNFSKYYTPSARSTEESYRLIIQSASTNGDNHLATQLINDAQKRFAENFFSNMDGTPGSWRPIYTSPENWYDSSIINSCKESNLEKITNSFTMLQSHEQFKWHIDDYQTTNTIHPGTKIHAIKFKYLMVQLSRPWLNIALFETGGWSVNGQARGFCSSGTATDNNGIFPLIPTSILIGTQAEIEADWHPDDKKYLDLLRSRNKKVGFGPFLLESEGIDPPPQVIGWISSLIPFSPQLGALKIPLKWIGKTIDELKNSLEDWYPLSIIIEIENYTNNTLKKIYEDKKHGLYNDSPLPFVEPLSKQGFSTYTPALYGPEGWIAYSFNAQYNIVLYWDNPYTGTNSGSISFIPKNVKLARENLEFYKQKDNAIISQGNFFCNATIGSGFQKAVFNYTISNV